MRNNTWLGEELETIEIGDAIHTCETWIASHFAARFMFVTFHINQIVTGIVFASMRMRLTLRSQK